MRVFRCPLSWCALAILVLTTARETSCAASEPQAAFLLNKGWVELALKQDGKPVADAGIEVIDEKGTKFAEGQTDDEGQAVFPLPPGSSFRVEIKTGNKTSDSIRLFKTDAGIRPAKILLSHGLSSCCRFKSPRETVVAGAPLELPPAHNDAVPIGLLLGAALAGLSGAAAIFLVARRHQYDPTPLSPRQ